MISNLLSVVPHDLSLPDWGPYSKRFFGISHLSDPEHGHRFDLTVIPCLFRRSLAVPDVLRSSGYLPWQASGDLEDYSYRQQLEWKDRIYVDISFVRLSDHRRLIRCDCVNRTSRKRNLAIHLAAGMELNTDEKTEVRLPDGGIWLDAVQDGKVTFARPRITDILNYDGARKGEVRTPDAVHGSCLGSGFGTEAGDCLHLPLPELQPNMTCWLRCRHQGQAELFCNGRKINLAGDGTWRLHRLPFPGNAQFLDLASAGGTALEIDGLALSPTQNPPEFPPPETDRRPIFTPGKTDNSLFIRYPGIQRQYALWWSSSGSFRRHYAVDDFNHLLYYADGVHKSFIKGYETMGGHDNFLDVVLQPVTVLARRHKILYAIIAESTSEKSDELLPSIPPDSEELEHIHAGRMKRTVTFPDTPWRFSQERMAAVMLTNAVYPTYVDGHYVRHHSPGKMWNSLYTWDSGFIGLGFLEFDLQRALESLCTYLTEPGSENAFIHHGSLVPVQLYLFHELWSQTQDDRICRELYPSLKQYYDVLAGHHPLSATRSHSREALLCPWDYFYNSGGWDDYPPQWEISLSGAKNILPVVTTAHAIRGARMLRFAAQFLDLPKDIAQFDQDIREMTQALQQYSWDPDAGYFSYVRHDDSGVPQGFFQAPDGSNFNQGLDGVSPLFAGAVTPEERKLLWKKLQSPRHFWTPQGLSTVDKSASYFKQDGYWNGSVWIPYMYFFWKAALNDGQGRFAWKIARTALNLWERETRESYACFEHFNAETGSGQGWHHFSGLSSPVICFHAAYAMPGHLSCGNDLLCREIRWEDHNVTARLWSCGVPGTPTCIILTLPPGTIWHASCNGSPVPMTEHYPGAWELTVSNAPELNIVLVKDEA